MIAPGKGNKPCMFHRDADHMQCETSCGKTLQEVSFMFHWRLTADIMFGWFYHGVVNFYVLW